MAQDSIKLVQDVGYPGTTAASNGGGVIRAALKRFFNTSGALIKFGKAVVLKAGSTNEIELPDDGTRVPVGLTIFNEYRGAGFPIDDSDLQGIPDGENAPVYTGGFDDYWVRLEAGVTIAPGDPVYVRHTVVNPATQELGMFTNATSANHFLWEGVNFVTSDKSVGIGASAIKVAAINISDVASL